MKLVRAYIKGFGKIENKNINFKPTLSVIYGDNASGKTTMSKFLLFTLAGFTKDEIEKYKPWSGAEFGGEIELLSDGGNEVPIEFNPESIEYNPPFNRTEFESMSYIPEEGGLDVTKGMEGSLLAKLKSRMVKLKNIENLVDLINNEKEIFEKISVKEKKIYEDIVSLQGEIKDLKNRYEEEKRIRKRYVMAVKKLKAIKMEIEKLKKLLTISKANMAKQLWEEIDQLRMEISNLGLKISELKKYADVDEEKIERVKELRREIDRVNEEINSLKKRYELRISEIARIREHLKKLVKGLKLEEYESAEAIELKIRNLELTLKLYKDKTSPKNIPDTWKAFDSFEDVEKKISKVRNLSIMLKELQEDAKKVEEELKSLEGEMRYARFKIHSRRVLIGIFFALAAGLFGVSFFTEFFLLLTVIASVSAGVALALWISMFDLKKTLTSIENEKMKVELNRKVIQDKVKKVKSELSRLTSLFEFEDHETLLNEYRLYEQWKSEWGTEMVSDEVKRVEQELREGLMEFYDEVNDDFEKLVEELRDKINLYMRLRERQGNLTLEAEEIKDQIENLNESLDSLNSEYKELLKELGCEDVDECMILIEKKKKFHELVKEREILEKRLRTIKAEWEKYKSYEDINIRIDQEVEPPEVIQEKIKDLEDRREELESNIEDLKELVKAKVVDVDEYYSKLSKVQELGIEHDFYLSLTKVFPEVFETFNKVRDNYIRRYKIIFEEKFLSYANRMFEEDEVRFVVRDDLGVEVSLPLGKNGSLDSLSRATRDQIELAYKLALHDTMLPDETQPLIIDNALVRYDEKRLKETLELLKEISEKRQVILLTSDKRVVSIIKSRNVIKI